MSLVFGDGIGDATNDDDKVQHGTGRSRGIIIDGQRSRLAVLQSDTPSSSNIGSDAAQQRQRTTKTTTTNDERRTTKDDDNDER